jgi:hypothetical protein
VRSTSHGLPARRLASAAGMFASSSGASASRARISSRRHRWARRCASSASKRRPGPASAHIRPSGVGKTSVSGQSALHSSARIRRPISRAASTVIARGSSTIAWQPRGVLWTRNGTPAARSRSRPGRTRCATCARIRAALLSPRRVADTYASKPSPLVGTGTGGSRRESTPCPTSKSKIVTRVVAWPAVASAYRPASALCHATGLGRFPLPFVQSPRPLMKK